MSEDIVKRLFNHSEHPVTGKMVLTNPDGPAAADEIERLRAALKLAQSLDDPLLLEIERQRQHISALEKALTVIAGTEDVQWSRHIAARHIAREALAKGNE